MGQNAEDLRQDIARTRVDLGGTIDAIGDRVMPGRIMDRKKSNLAVRARSMKDRVMGAAHVPSEKAHELMGAASDKMHGLADEAGSMPENMRHRAQGTPLAAGAVMFGIGFLVAAAIPPSEKEKEWSGQLIENAEPLKEKVSEAGQEMVEHLREPASQAVSELKDAATGAAQEVSSTASDAARQTTEQAKQATQTMKDGA
ncbi:MAG TPA: DUF3618 domain-containing protein [Ilumatobacteraceae bacterium]|jgi:hypothetical protein